MDDLKILKAKMGDRYKMMTPAHENVLQDKRFCLVQYMLLNENFYAFFQSSNSCLTQEMVEDIKVVCHFYQLLVTLSTFVHLNSRT